MRAARRPRVPITREAIVECALRLVDRDGLDALSMRRVAEELDTGAASLYWHVGSKEGLLDLLFDRVIGEHAVPDPDPERWREQLKEVARSMRAEIARHRDIVRLSMGRFPTGPNALRWTERLLAILRAGGLPDRLAVAGVYLLTVVVDGFSLDEPGSVQQRASGEGPRQHVMGSLQMMGNYAATLPQERFPNLVAVADEFSDDSDEHFELLLDLFVDGLAARGDVQSSRHPKAQPSARVQGDTGGPPPAGVRGAKAQVGG